MNETPVKFPRRSSSENGFFVSNFVSHTGIPGLFSIWNRASVPHAQQERSWPYPGPTPVAEGIGRIDDPKSPSLSTCRVCS